MATLFPGLFSVEDKMKMFLTGFLESSFILLFLATLYAVLVMGCVGVHGMEACL